MLAVFGTLAGVLLSGILLIVNTHLQTKREEARRSAERKHAVRMDSLEHVKDTITIGSTLIYDLQKASVGLHRPTDFQARTESFFSESNRAMIAIGALEVGDMAALLVEAQEAVRLAWVEMSNDQILPLEQVAKIMGVLSHLERRYMELASVT